jgi:hypothetical protein
MSCTSDWELAAASVATRANLDPEIAATGHGGLTIATSVLTMVAAVKAVR